MHRYPWWLRRFARTAANDFARLPDTQRIIATRRNDSWNREPWEVFGQSWSWRESRVAGEFAEGGESRDGRAGFIRARLHRGRRLVEHRAATVRIRDSHRRGAQDDR